MFRYDPIFSHRSCCGTISTAADGRAGPRASTRQSMMRRYIVILVFVLSEAIFVVSRSYGNGLEVKLRLQKRNFSLGETVQFYVELRNISSRPLRVLPQPRIFPADNFQVRRVTDGKEAEILRYGEQSLDYPGLAKQ